ncbi:nuclear transport factor 2 family protein [Bernardetia sp. OM2101]|uniref:nuclear transport factor 2 family protein n=1 Tax=Bernardetia sp. OM2101 TaxID=3344876 RepID=UPI0035CFE586
MKNTLLFLFFIALFLVFGFAAMAQTPTDQSADTLSQEQKEVIKPIEQLFEGMFKGDSSMIRAAFYKNPTLRTITKNKKTDEQLADSKLEDFLVTIATPHDQPYIEKVLSYDIKIDDNLAQVWTPYEFYVGEMFSHCGVNAFHIIQTEEGWKIIGITDTRRREGCK